MAASPYCTLVELSAPLADVKLLDNLSKDSIADANILLARLRPVLDAARTVALHSCEVPIEFNSGFFSRHMDEVGSLSNLALAFRFAADVAAFNADFDLVAQHGIDILDLANATRRGGLIVDHLIALGISGCGISALRSFRDRFEDGVRCELLTALNRYEREREPFGEIESRDAKWEAESGYSNDESELSEDEWISPDCDLSVEEQRTMFQLIKEFGNRPKIELQSMFADQDRHSVAMTRLLFVDLAIRSWNDRTGRFPHSLSELAPDIVPVVPHDPFTDDRFIYRKANDSFELYRTGPDKADSGGRFGSWLAVSGGGYDLCLDADDYWTSCCAVSPRPGLVRRLLSRLKFWQRQDQAR